MMIVFHGLFCVLCAVLAGFAASMGRYGATVLDLVFALWIATKMVAEIEALRERRRRENMVNDMKRRRP